MSDLTALVEEGKARLLDQATSSGGWSYRPGGDVFVEPTALALLALAPHHVPDSPADAPSLSVLLESQKEPGFFGVFPKDPEPSWTTSLCILALAAHGHAEPAKRAAAWLVRWRAKQFDAETVEQTRKDLEIDVSIPAWPWFGDTAGWVEPTAMACLALRATPVQGGKQRQDHGVRYLKDRCRPDGGWNYGNPKAFGRQLYPMTIPTAKATLALTRLRGETVPEVSRSLGSLADMLRDNPSRKARGWGSLALSAAGIKDAAEAEARAAVDPNDDRGPWGGHADDTALTVLALRAAAGRGAPGL